MRRDVAAGLDAEVDEDVGPVVVQVELDGAAVEGPVCDVASAVGDAGAC